MAQTDHGTVRGFFKFFRACEKYGVKPIYGMEAYLCNDRFQRGLTEAQVADAVRDIPSKKEQKEAVKEAESKFGVRERFHTCLFAKDDTGLRNLFKLASIGWLEGFYYRPRIDVAALEQHHEGLILSTACTGGILSHLLGRGEVEKMVEMTVKLYDIFGEDLFLEIMPHDFDAQRQCNLALVRIAEGLNIPLVATNDAHYALAEHWRLHEVLLAMQSRTTWSDPNRWKFTGGHDFYLKSREEMETSFTNYHPGLSTAVVKQALDNTMLLGERCQVKIKADTKQCLLPKVQIPERHRAEFMTWAAEVYPEFYQLEHDLPSLPCPADCEAPSTAPYVVGSDTSEAAAKMLEGKTAGDRRRILRFITYNGGATCEEVETALDMKHQTASARISEMSKAGVLYDAGERKLTSSHTPATVWKATVQP